MNQDKKVVKISDVVKTQIPEFILTENPNFEEFLKQYYISQEFQGGVVDLSENLIDYKNSDSFDTTNLIKSTTLDSDIEFYDDEILVASTNGWPEKYGLLKIDNEIITYTGITTNSFTGCIRGFSGIESLKKENDPEYLVFTESQADFHAELSVVHNLSNLFLLEFLRKVKYQFTPGFEDLNFDANINIPNFISKVKDFYRSKGTDEAFRILFKVLYGKDVEIIKPKDSLFTTSDDQWIVVESFICEAISGNPLNINGQTLYQDANNQKTILNANGSIYNVTSAVLKGSQYYNVNIFSGYSNNLNPKGSIFGEFKVTPKSYCILDVSSGSNTIPVVSTIGFDFSGTLSIGSIEVTYTDKTNTEFLNCTGITTDISSGSSVYANNYAYSYENGDLESVVKLRLLNTLSSIDVNEAVLAYEEDVLKIDNLGILDENVFTKSLHYNIPSIIFAGEIFDSLPNYIEEGVSSSNGAVRTKYKNYLKENDIVDVYDYTTNQKIYESNITNVNEDLNEFSITPSDLLIVGHKIKLKRKVVRSQSNSYPEIVNKFLIDVQDSYEDDNNYYITSNGFPYDSVDPYKREYEFLIGSDAGFETLVQQHNFYTGELVTVVSYEVDSPEAFKNTIGISTGSSYYVLRINENLIRLSNSQDQLFRQTYINFSESTNSVVTSYVKNIKLALSKIYGNDLTSTKTFKKIAKTPSYPQVKKETTPGSIGIFANGVEIQNYKSFDNIYYGPIESVNVLNSGTGYDLLNPPKFSINFGNDTQTILVPQLKGTLEKISIIDPGYDYVEVPIITISGGNNESVKTEVRMKLVSKEIDFDAGDINTVVTLSNYEKFIFKTQHKLIAGDGVIYQSFNNPKIGIGASEYLIDNGLYYVSQVGSGTSFRLANSKSDAILEQNLITLRSLGKGIHRFTSTKKVKAIDAVNIIDTNLEFDGKKLLVSPIGMNHYDNIIESENHGFSTNEEIVYSYSGPSVSGISTLSYYYVIKIDDNKFKLSSSKTSESIVNFGVSSPSSTHFFQYSPIRVNIAGKLTKVGLSTIGYPAQLVPIVRGSVTDVSVQTSAYYGYDSILNYQVSPNIEVLEGKNASIGVLVQNGKIVNTIIFNQGSNYYNSIELNVIGTGYGAELYPVIVNGKIVDVKIVSSGIGYSEFTRVEIKKIGNDLHVSSNIKKWTLNECSKYSQDIIDNGILIGDNYHPNRNSLGVFNLIPKFKTIFGINSNSHSPIIGWTYDGCPIYGPYAYENVDGTGNIVEMTSSYKKIKIGPQWYEFIEDYQYEEGYGSLDAHNGRYCITPEYPNGIYAYFATSSFPYIVGNTYNYSTVKDNFKFTYTQDINFNELAITKHTFPYYVRNKQNYYDYFDFCINEKEDTFVVKKTSNGSVDNLKIISSGENYSIGDSILFDNDDTNGFGALAQVSELYGVGISSITSKSISLSNITFVSNNNSIIGICTTAHNLKDNYYVNISGISSNTYSSLEGSKKIRVANVETKILQGLQETLVSGIVTSIKVQESISNFDIDSNIQINTEVLRIIGLDYTNNRINVLRQQFFPQIPSGSKVTLLQNKFIFDSAKSLGLTEKDETYYFRSNLVSVGISTLVGAGNTLTLYPLGLGVSETRYIRTAGIWAPNHKFKTGDKVTYTVNLGDTSPQTNYNSQYLNTLNNLYIVDLGNDVIGLTTQKNKTSTDNNLLYFTSTGTGNLHKLKTNRNIVTGNLSFNETVVSTASSHGLSVNDVVKLNVISGITTQFIVDYDSPNAKLTVNGQNNPKINVYNNEIVEFNLSSANLTDTKFNIYTDINYQNEYLGSGVSAIEVIKEPLKLTLQITENTPKVLYYNLESDLRTVYDDISVDKNNTIEINDSLYNYSCGVVTTTSNTFTVNLPTAPERNTYISDENISLTYTVLSSNATGPIYNTKFSSKGYDYKKLPSISDIVGSGKNAKIIAQTNTIGKIVDVSFPSNSIFPTDKTVKPVSNLYSTLHLINDYQVKDINLTYGGENYLISPEVYLYNTNTNTISNSFSAFAELKGSSVNDIIVSNKGKGLVNEDNKVIFTNNSNGIKILSVSKLETSPGIFRVSLTLETPISGFTTSSPLDFKVGDEIFVENIESIGAGYNSSDYSYNNFDVVGIVTNFNSQNQSILRYNISGDPGTIISVDTAYVINAKNLPIAEIVFEPNEFVSGEPLNNTTVLENRKYKFNKSLIKVYDSNELDLNEKVTGKYSLSEGIISEIDTYKSNLSTNVSKSKSLGWIKGRGYLSEITQKLQDNDYYQNFSYSLKSDIEINDWNSPVSDLCHITGFKKFSDLKIESKDITQYTINTDSYSPINVSIYTYSNINTINDFDLVSEDVEDHNNLYSEVLKFKNRKLTDYILSKENVVLSIDDIKGNFNEDAQYTEIVIDTQSTNGDGSLSVKYVVFVESSRSIFSDYELPLFAEIFMTRVGEDVNLTTYSYFQDVDLGNFVAGINPDNADEMQLKFVPNSLSGLISIHSIKSVVLLTEPQVTTNYGNTSNVAITTSYAAQVTPTQKIINLVNTSECTSGNIFVGICSSSNSSKEFYEMSFLYDGVNIQYDVYSREKNLDLGIIGISTDISKNIILTYDGISGIGVTVYVNATLIRNTYVNPNIISLDYGKLVSSGIQTTTSSPIGITSFQSDYSASKFAIEVKKTVGVTTTTHIIQLNCIHYSVNGEKYLNNINYSYLGNLDDLNFNTIFDQGSKTYTLVYYPNANANYNIKYYQQSILRATNPLL